MKKTWLLSCILTITAFSSKAQTVVDLFQETAPEVKASLDLNFINTYSLLDVNESTWEFIKSSKPGTIAFSLPYGDLEFNFILNKADLFRDDLIVRTASGDTMIWSEISESVYYQGVVTGYENAQFTLSVLNNEIIGIGSIPGIGDLNLGKHESSGHYVFYAENALDGHNDFNCETRGEASPYNPRSELETDDRRIWTTCSGVYFEVDYDIFLAKGGVVESVDFMTALFAQIQYMFELADMGIFITEIMVWDEESPYYEISDTGTLLDLFGTTTTVWDGDLGHFVNLAGSGGLAWLDVFCHPNQALKKAVSGISLTFEEIPIYSWSVEVIAHEMGHNFGSPHTHACFWNGDDTAIDGCGPEAGFDEGCEGIVPPLGGTVMSYCHLTPVGINFINGFGMQPGTHMRNRMVASGCLVGCDLTEMDVQFLDGTISETCENAPITMSFDIANNGNENLTNFRAEMYVNGELFTIYDWGGLVYEEGTGSFNFPSFTLPEGTYTIVINIVAPNGYEDENPADNSFTFNIDVTPFPVADFLATPDELSSLNAESQMVNLSTGASSYTWNFGDGSALVYGTNPTHVYPFEKGGNYHITLIATSEFGCEDTTHGKVLVNGENIFYIENAFTPDGDLYNDEFRPIFSAGLDIYDYHLVIYNRWGEIVFESYDATKGWDGTYGNREAPAGTYIWAIDFGDLSSDEKHSHTGHVTLLR